MLCFVSSSNETMAKQTVGVPPALPQTIDSTGTQPCAVPEGPPAPLSVAVQATGRKSSWYHTCGGSSEQGFLSNYGFGLFTRACPACSKVDGCSGYQSNSPLCQQTYEGCSDLNFSFTDDDSFPSARNGGSRDSAALALEIASCETENLRTELEPARYAGSQDSATLALEVAVSEAENLRTELEAARAETSRLRASSDAESMGAELEYLRAELAAAKADAKRMRESALSAANLAASEIDSLRAELAVARAQVRCLHSPVSTPVAAASEVRPDTFCTKLDVAAMEHAAVRVFVASASDMADAGADLTTAPIETFANFDVVDLHPPAPVGIWAQMPPSQGDCMAEFEIEQTNPVPPAASVEDMMDERVNACSDKEANVMSQDEDETDNKWYHQHDLELLRALDVDTFQEYIALMQENERLRERARAAHAAETQQLAHHARLELQMADLRAVAKQASGFLANIAVEN